MSASEHLNRNISLAPLAVFRIAFGLLMLFSVLRFWVKGWIYDLYIAPGFHFKYYGFEWVQAADGPWMYAIFALMALSAIGIALGLFYRISAAAFFLAFTYVELLDVANYLNHYYFVSLVAFLLIFLPAHHRSSLDVRFGFTNLSLSGNWWYVNILRILLALVYFYAGVAKLNPDWMLQALPLKIWLPAKADVPFIGWLFDYEWVAYAFSWFGALYDLSIPFLLWNKKTRPYAFVAVVVFHLLTWILFPIGVFPWVMICSTLIFFSAGFHTKILTRLEPVFGRESSGGKSIGLPDFARFALVVFLSWQLLFPLRFVLYPGHLFWTEQGYRFSWRVMLMEKAGYITYYILDPRTGNSGEAHPADYLTPNQEKQLATQPDLIVQFAHYLEDIYREKGIKDPVITVKAYVSLNGSRSRLFIDPGVDLTQVEDNFAPKDWILDYEN